MTRKNALNSEVAERVPKRPEWLNDEPEIFAILSAFLDKLDQRSISDRVRIPSIRIDKKIAPVLHRNDEAADRTWSLLRSLEGSVFKFRPNRKRQPYDPEYLGASLQFLEGAEEICRDWLTRPVKKRYQEEWMAAVAAQADVFLEGGASLMARPVKVPGKSAYQVVEAFAQIGDLSDSNLTLRQISARVFWGNSKLLDSREELLLELYPRFVLAPRPVLVHVYLPQTCKGVLFLENLDTYIQALAGRPTAVEGLALVYVAGFRGGAERIRTREGACLHYQRKSYGSVQEPFEDWWFSERASLWPVWFCGDLDYSGMAILKVLRQRFGDVQAWQPGYVPMLRALREGGGHFADLADKTEQVDPGTTGCPYADQILLPAMREIGRFVDQEAV